jgi:hypothetical protein
MKFSNGLKISTESLLLAILILLAFRFYIMLYSSYFNGLAPLIFLPFLISPYLRKSAKFLGWFLGGIVLTVSLSITDNFIILFASVFLGGLGYFYSSALRNKPNTLLDIIWNIIVTLITLWIISGVVSVLYDIKNLITFNQAYNMFFSLGIIITLIINIPIMHFYGNKLNILK